MVKDKNNRIIMKKVVTFDPKTYLDWEKRNITKISIEFISSGCEGTSIKIHENVILDWYIPYHIDERGIIIYNDSLSQEILKNAYITRVWSNWILKSESILTKCSCWKSFGIKTGNLKIDNIRILKSKLSKHRWNHH